jgi:oligopeptide transport system ATP-binding protein
VSEPILEVTDLVKHYPVRSGLRRRETATVRAVDGVSFSLQEGETFGLVGESGCGKSTLVKTLLYLEPPTSGTIRFRGREITSKEASSLRRHVQIVFQDPYTSLPPRMNVGEIVADPIRIHHELDQAAVRAKVEQVLREVGINPDRAGEYPFQFSGGQRQRIGIARALAVDPSVVLLDEAVSSLDVSVQAQVLNLLKDLQDGHKLTYVFISHDLGLVGHMSDRIGVMYLGRIVELGHADDLTSDPLHPYTRALLSAVPSLNRKRTERIRLAGEPPKPTDPPAGCAFHPRCPMAQSICSQETPALLEWRPGRFSACHFAQDVAARLGRIAQSAAREPTKDPSVSSQDAEIEESTSWPETRYLERTEATRPPS